MSNIVKAKVTIRGVRPLLQHHFGVDALPLEKQERTGVAGNDPEEWRKTAMVNKKGQLYVEPTYIFATLREAAKYTKSGKGSIMTKVAASLQVLDDVILIDRYFPDFPKDGIFDIKSAEPPPHNELELPVYLDVRSVKNPSTKARNIRYRLACSKGWQTEFNILWGKTIVSTNEMKAVGNDAGVLVGLADGRSVGYGRFEVVSFEVSE